MPVGPHSCFHPLPTADGLTSKLWKLPAAAISSLAAVMPSTRRRVLLETLMGNHAKEFQAPFVGKLSARSAQVFPPSCEIQSLVFVIFVPQTNQETSLGTFV